MPTKTETNDMLLWEIEEFGEKKSIPKFLEGAHIIGQAISTVFKLKSRKSKHLENFYQDFKNKFEEIQPLAEKLHDRMSTFKNEREEIAKKINESNVPEEEKGQYLKEAASAYDSLEEYLIPIPWRLTKMQNTMENMKKFDKNSDYDVKKENRGEFMDAYNDVYIALAKYKEQIGIIEGIKIAVNDEIDQSAKHGV